MTVEESLAMFLYVIAHNLKFHVIKGIYIQLIETISKHFFYGVKWEPKVSG